jgi:Methyltransferase domain
MSTKPNAQYNTAHPNSLAVRVATRVRASMFDTFIRQFAPCEEETVIDIGVTSDQSYTSSNYFEALYPFKHRITAAGIDDARFLEKLYPGVRFIFADALNLPFSNLAFDLVHSSAVLEHVGSLEHQAKMVAECLRIARRGVFLTTPNRWFPIEFHTQLPLVHWLPKPMTRAVFRKVGLEFFAEEKNLNLMTESELKLIGSCHKNWSFQFMPVYLLGWKSNLVMMGKRR